MAADYSTGSAASFADLQSAIETFLTTVGGWAAAAGPAASGSLAAQRLWTKGDLVVRVAAEGTTALHFMGATGVGGGTSTGDAPYSVNFGSPAGGLIAFPFTYELFWNDDPEEIYVVISYGGNKYQHVNWGESDVPDIGGTGMWITGSYRQGQDLTNATYAPRMFMSAAKDLSGTGSFGITAYGGMNGGFFLHGSSPDYGSSFIHTGLEGTSWKRNNNGAAGGIVQQLQAGDLMMAMPSLFNEAEVLVPIYATLQRVDNVYTVAGILRNARLMRLDNVTPGDIITYGSDEWKCYPWFAKNVAERNGVSWATGAFHSGTFGVAIRYPGP